MKKFNITIGLLAIITAAFVIYFVLKNEQAVVANPKGLMAHREWNVITTHTLLMLVIVAPTLLTLFIVAWKYRASNQHATYEPRHSQGVFRQLILWIPPTIIVAIMAVFTWKETHELDPYQPIKSETKTLPIQVVALDWKWLFIYPEQDIATINFVQFPAQTPIQFSLSADNSPMNSFWIPQLSGQIYSMTGMVTPLHIMADGPGEYRGKAAEMNGEGYAKMTFIAKSCLPSDFEEWVASVKKSPLILNDSAYKELAQRSVGHPITLYSEVEKDLFNKILMKYLPPEHKK